ncbi:MAG: gliding motility-associated protein GldE [Bacteroidia bacterium]|nr:gliding motility-associated protein GldE [Bacteroidia bacterium]
MDDTGPVGTIVLNSVFRTVDPADYITLLGLAIGMLICLFFSAIGSSGENAFFSHKDNDVEELRYSRSSTSKIILHLLSYPKHLLATILVLNSLMVVCFVLLAKMFTEIILNLEGQPFIQFLVDAILVTLIILIFGEVIPKVYATSNFRKVAIWLAYPMRALMFFFWPLTNLLVKSTTIIEKKVKKKAPELTPEELSHAIDITSDQTDSQQEKDILKGIVNIAQTQVSQIMKPRMDVVALQDSINFNEVLDTFRVQRFSRMPVYHESLDHIVGVINMKDLLDCLEEPATFNWTSRMRQPFFVPENKKIDDLLHEFRQNRNHLAIIVDEFGGSNGIVTLEDVLEEVFGEIQDEFDDETEQYSRLDENTYLFEGKTQLVDFLRITHLPMGYFDEINQESDTLAGVVTEIAGRIPAIGEEIIFSTLTFYIDAADLRRVKRVKVKIADAEGKDE